MSESHSVGLIVFFAGYLVLGTILMWVIVSGVGGANVNYVNIPSQGYINSTSSLNFTSGTLPNDYYKTDSALGGWVSVPGVGLVSRPYPLFPSVLQLKGLVPEADGSYHNHYYINNTNHDRFGIIIESVAVYGDTIYLEFQGSTITAFYGTSLTDFNGESLHYDGGFEDFTSYSEIEIITVYNPTSRVLTVSKVDEFGTADLFTWTLGHLPFTHIAPAYFGGVIAFEKDTVVRQIDTRAMITYNPQTDVYSQGMNFLTFMMAIITFTAPVNLFPPPFISILIPALFFYLPTLGLLAAVISILWPVV